MCACVCVCFLLIVYTNKINNFFQNMIFYNGFAESQNKTCAKPL